MSGFFRFILGLLLALSLAVCGFAASTWLGGMFLVPEGQGLAGPAEAVGYGLMAALAGLILGAFLTMVLRSGALRMLTLLALIPAAIILFFIGYRLTAAQSEMEAQFNSALANLRPFTLNVGHAESVADRPFASIAFDTGANAFSVTRMDGSVCMGTLPPESSEKLVLLTAMRGVEILLAQNANPCAVDLAEHNISFRIDEALPPATEVNFGFTEACADQNAPLRALLDAADDSYRAHQASEVCG